jgi:HlyD family secretion protein
VNKGQVVARLDTTLLDIAVREARANLIRNQAELDKAERDFERFSKLSEEGITSGSDLDAAHYALDVATANLSGAQVSLDRSEQNLEYATITAPISGVVVERNVDVGQTVAASLSAPQLLLLAADLARMQIMVSVDESDIGLIKEGQTARFTVQAFPDDTFSGSVQQVRLQSTSEENVVNYSVVVDVSNDDGRLLPGMTATVDFLVDQATDVLRVSNSALRFRPTEAMIEEVQRRREEQGADRPARPNGATQGETSRDEMKVLFFFEEDGSLAAAPVRTGLSDSQWTEIQGPPVVTAGLQVIAGTTTGSSTTTSAVKNPFQNNQTQNQRPMGPPPGPGM